MRIIADGPWFKDEAGRTRLLRGANLSGSSKMPFTPDGRTFQRAGFYAHRAVSFVGRPFPLAEADEHLRRLRAWGLHCIRFLITWEAIEHAGPGEYDEAYLDYVRAVVQKAGDYGLTCFIDPHQDVWSRWTGGDGAPGWTLEAVGFDLARLHESGATLNHQEHGDPLPRMIWPTNYSRLAAATMFTLFFAGNDFAPAARIAGEPTQDYLQRRYIAAVRQVAERLRGLDNVIGYDTLNEPVASLAGMLNLDHLPETSLIINGPMPTIWQGIQLAAGYPQTVGVYEMGFTGPQQINTVTLNLRGLRAWREGYDCVWKQNGVWTDDDGAPRLLRPDHFAQVDGRPPHFADDYLKPFILRFTREIRAVDPDAVIFIEGTPTGADHYPTWTAADPVNVASAAHWYDGLTLFSKQYNPDFTLDTGTMQMVMGSDESAASMVEQLRRHRDTAAAMHMPTLIGEFGLPFDLDDKRAYRDGDFSAHVQALDRYYNAMDANLLSCTIWNYTPDNSNARGDGWNDEDLSVFSRDQQRDPDDLHSGGRALAGFVRPYAQAVAGEPLLMRYTLATKTFELVYRPDPTITAPTEIFLPDFVYPTDPTVSVEGGVGEWRPAERWRHVQAAPGAAECRVVVRG